MDYMVWTERLCAQLLAYLLAQFLTLTMSIVQSITVTTRECHPQKQQLKERQLHDQESTILKLLYQYYPRLSCLTYYGSIPNSI